MLKVKRKQIMPVVTLDDAPNGKSSNEFTAKLKYEPPVISNLVSVNSLTQGGADHPLESVGGGAFSS